jgi:hypothetical protein
VRVFALDLKALGSGVSLAEDDYLAVTMLDAGGTRFKVEPLPAARFDKKLTEPWRNALAEAFKVVFATEGPSLNPIELMARVYPAAAKKMDTLYSSIIDGLSKAELSALRESPSPAPRFFVPARLTRHRISSTISISPSSRIPPSTTSGKPSWTSTSASFSGCALAGRIWHSFPNTIRRSLKKIGEDEQASQRELYAE